MSQPVPLPSQSVEADVPRDLSALRAAIDETDDALHDLLMRRAGLVSQVALLGRAGKIPFRPGREAAIVRRLLARHSGTLPHRAVARLWRELFAATTAMQGRFVISVCEPQDHPGLAALAREHFGALSPLRVHRSPTQAIAEVGSAVATTAVLPMPAEDEPARAAWWVTLLHQDEPRVHIVARLPFWAAGRPEGTPSEQALVVAAAAPDPSGQDRSLIGFEAPAHVSRARLLASLTAAGLSPLNVLLRRDTSGGTHGLIDVDGLVASDDPRLAALSEAVQNPVVLGAYAVPVTETLP